MYYNENWMILLAWDRSLMKWRSGDALEKSLARISSAAPRFGRRNQTNVTRAHHAPSSGAPGDHLPAVLPSSSRATFSVALAPKARKNNLKIAPRNLSQKYCPSIIQLTVTIYYQLLMQVCYTWRNCITNKFLALSGSHSDIVKIESLQRTRWSIWWAVDGQPPKIVAKCGGVFYSVL